MKHVFIINPTSGVGRYKDVEAWIDNNFKDKEDNYELRYTEYPDHAQEIAEEYHGNDVILYSVGGDGTAHEILNGLDFDVQLAIIPVGTGNDFWRMIAYDHPLEKILEDTINGSVRHVDVGEANGHRFLNCMNMGVDSEVNRDVNAVRKTWFPRKLIYVYYAIIELVRKKPIQCIVEADGLKKNHHALLISVMNGRWYGNGFQSAPKAVIDDGFLDVCIVEDVPQKRIPKLMPMYYKGEHLDLDVVTSYKAREIKIECDRTVALGCDGEVFEYSTIHARVLEGKLKLRVPNAL